MSITINQSVTSLLKRRAHLSLPTLKKIAICKEKIAKLEEEMASYTNMLNVDNQWAMEIFGKNIIDLIIVKKVNNRTKLEYNPEYFNIETKAITDKLGRIITKEVITWKGVNKSESDTDTAIGIKENEIPNGTLNTVPESQAAHEPLLDVKESTNTLQYENEIMNEIPQEEAAFPVEDMDGFSQFPEEL